ncbi:MAG: AAA family ATPase [Acidimicrobiales bacterium]
MSAETAPSRDHLVELSVRDLGIIEDARFVVGPGMTALTGETGAGKTLLVGAIELLLGGRADPSMVRNGASQAVVEGRFELGGEEVVLARVVPAVGRSRAYIDGRMATAGALGEAAGSVIDLHGQHEHQSLLSPAVQRDALDRFGDIDLDPLRAARAERARVAAALDGLGGDAGAREREADLLRFQLAELRDAALTGPDEDDHLDREEDRLGDARAPGSRGDHGPGARRRGRRSTRSRRPSPRSTGAPLRRGDRPPPIDPGGARRRRLRGPFDRRGHRGRS